MTDSGEAGEVSVSALAGALETSGFFGESEAQPEKKKEVQQTEQPNNEEVPAESEQLPEVEAEAEEETPTEEDGEAVSTGTYDENAIIVVSTDGKEEQVPLKELIKGYHRSHNYEKKSSSLREERELYEREVATARAERQRYAEVMEQAKAAMQNQLSEFDQIDWDTLSVEDPAKYIAERHRHDKAKKAMEIAEREQSRVSEAVDRERQARLAAYAKEQTDALFKAMPEFAKPETQQRWEQYALDSGFTREQLQSAFRDSFLHHTIIVWGEKARRYDAAQKSGAVEQVKNAPKILRPGTSKPSGQRNADALTAANQRLKKNGTVNDLAAVLTAMDF